MDNTRLGLQTKVALDLGHPLNADDQQLVAGDIQDALALAEGQWYRDTWCAQRAASVAAVDDQALYALPADMIHLIDVAWVDANGYSHRVKKFDRSLLQRLDPSYRTASSGTPLLWMMETPGQARLYPPTAVIGGETLTLNGHIIPYDAGSDAPFTGGIVPMDADDDLCSLPARYALALAHYAVWWLAVNQLITDPVAQGVAAGSLAQYQELKANYLADELI